MSRAWQIRRSDKEMPEESVRAMIEQAYCGRLATVGADGWPYVVPLLHVWRNEEIWVHNTRAHGHLRANVEHDPRVCFEVDEAGAIFPYGRFECDTSLAYRSVIATGRIRIVDDPSEKQAFFEALMEKQSDPAWDRTKEFFPRLDQVTIYAITPERMTGKETPLPPPRNQWPTVDNTRSPDAAP